MSRLIQVPLDLLDDGTNVRTPAKRLSQSDLGLRASIRELGVLQPITVVRRGKRYEVLYGHRRTAAARDIHLATIPAIVEPDPDAKPIRQLVENQHRQPVNPIDIARTLRAYLDEHPGVTQSDLARQLGRSSYWISVKLQLLDMDERTQEAVATGRMGEGRAYANHKASTTQPRKGRPRILTADADDPASASVTVSLPGPSGTPAKATIGLERGAGTVELLLEDGSGYGVMLTLTGAAARLLGLRLSQASQAQAVAS